MFRRSDGAIIVVHLDHRAEPPPVSSEAFVSVIRPDRQAACVDARLELAPDAQPAFGFDRDQLLVLEQVVTGMDLAAVLRRIEVETEGCRWVEVQR